ncbi:MAG: hypothetical protein II764_06100 [Bacteroidales bacterium]|jgi:hypothetical protein|nr:hypothetical protein [Bacteroidales bacterium]
MQNWNLPSFNVSVITPLPEFPSIRNRTAETVSDGFIPEATPVIMAPFSGTGDPQEKTAKAQAATKMDFSIFILDIFILDKNT